LSGEIDLEKLEKKTWKSTYEDGLWDIYFGFLIFGFALVFIADYLGIPEPFGLMLILSSWYMIPILLLMLGKKYITQKRIGYAKFGARRKRTKKRLMYFLLANVVISTIFAIFTPLGIFGLLPIEGILVPLFIGLVFIAFPLCILAFFLEFTRLYIYAIVYGLGFTFSELFYPFVGTPLDLFFSFGVPGFIIALIGVNYFIIFLRNYPKE
jgi:hypothetical protein